MITTVRFSILNAMNTERKKLFKQKDFPTRLRGDCCQEQRYIIWLIFMPFYGALPITRYIQFTEHIKGKGTKLIVPADVEVTCEEKLVIYLFFPLVERSNFEAYPCFII